MPAAASAVAEGNDAIERCAAELAGAGDLYLCFATAALQPAFERGLQAFDAQVFGCSAAGVIGGDREIEQAPAAVALALRDVDVLPLRAPLDDGGSQAGFGLGNIWPGDAVAGLVMADYAAFNGDRFLREFQRVRGFAPLAGGLGSGPSHASIFCGDRVSSSAMAALILRGRLRCEIVVSPCCEPLTAPATIAVSESNTIHKLGDATPIDILRETVVNTPEGGEAARTGNIFGGILLDDRKAEPGRGDYLIRTLVGADNDAGSISISGPAPVGERFAFLYRTPEVAGDDLSARLADVKRRSDGAAPLFGVYFDCAGRGRALYEEDSVDIGIIRRELGDFPLVGFHGNGELAPAGRRNVLHNFTGVLALVWERE